MAWVVGLIVPIWSAPNSVNQRLPSGPGRDPLGLRRSVGSGNSVMAPVSGLIMPILIGGEFREPEVAVGTHGDRIGLGMRGRGRRYSVMTSVVGSIMPILPAPSSVNQRLPSGPTVIPYGSESAVGVGISLIVPVEGSRTPIWPTRSSVNQTLPSGPSMRLVGYAAAVGIGVVWMACVTGSIEPIRLLPCSTNQICPPGPCAIATGTAAAFGRGYSTQ